MVTKDTYLSAPFLFCNAFIMYNFNYNMSWGIFLFYLLNLYRMENVSSFNVQYKPVKP